MSSMLADFSISTQNEHLNLILTHKLSTNEIDETYFGTLNQMIVAYDRLWSEIDLIQRLDWSLRFKKRCADCFKV